LFITSWYKLDNDESIASITEGSIVLNVNSLIWEESKYLTVTTEGFGFSAVAFVEISKIFDDTNSPPTAIAPVFNSEL
jgi:hypothetical protein